MATFPLERVVSGTSTTIRVSASYCGLIYRIWHDVPYSVKFYEMSTRKCSKLHIWQVSRILPQWVSKKFILHVYNMCRILFITWRNIEKRKTTYFNGKFSSRKEIAFQTSHYETTYLVVLLHVRSMKKFLIATIHGETNNNNSISYCFHAILQHS